MVKRKPPEGISGNMQIANIPTKGQYHQDPKLLVIHSMGQFIDTDSVDYYAPDFLSRLNLRVHYLIDPSGVIIKCLDENIRGAHAKGYNVDSIGIEMLVKGIHDYYTFLEAIKTKYYTNDQYSAVVELGRGIVKRYPGIKVVRHSDIDPENKFDPGVGFDWGRFLNDIDP